MLRKLTTVVLILVLTLVCSAALAEKYLVVTETDPLLVRDAPYGGAVIGRVPKGTVIEGTRYDNWKVQINWHGQVGYLYSGYLQRVTSSSTSTSSTSSQVTTTRASAPRGIQNLERAETLLPGNGDIYQVALERAATVRIWSKKSQDTRWSKVRIKLENGSYVRIIEIDRDWARVYYSEDGDYGWVILRYLAPVYDVSDTDINTEGDSLPVVEVEPIPIEAPPQSEG